MKSQSPHRASHPLHVTTCDSSLGRLLVATGDSGIAAVLLGDDDADLHAELRQRFPAAELLPEDERTDAAAAAVIAAIASQQVNGSEAGATIALDLRGTAFQRAVWAALRDIPRGATATYTEVAARVGRPSAVRAVAQACAANAHAVLIPCHRVVRSDGALSGYRWGIERKRALLREEGAAIR